MICPIQCSNLTPIKCDDDHCIGTNNSCQDNNNSTAASCCISMVPLLVLLPALFALVKGKGEYSSHIPCQESINEH